MTEFLDLQPRRWNLIVSPSLERLLISIAYGAYNSTVTVLDCGRQYDASIVARAAKGREEILDCIKIQRAFNCFEVAKLIEQTPAEKTPVVILDVLATFLDESVKIDTRRFLLESSFQHFQRLSQYAGLAVSAYPVSEDSDASVLFERLLSAAPHISNYADANKGITRHESMGGNSSPTITDILHREEASLSRFRRILRPEDKNALDDLFTSAYKHRSAAEHAKHLLPFETFLLSASIELHKEVVRLRDEVNTMKKQNKKPKEDQVD